MSRFLETLGRRLAAEDQVLSRRGFLSPRSAAIGTAVTAGAFAAQPPPVAAARAGDAKKVPIAPPSQPDLREIHLLLAHADATLRSDLLSVIDALAKPGTGGHPPDAGSAIDRMAADVAKLRAKVSAVNSASSARQDVLNMLSDFGALLVDLKGLAKVSSTAEAERINRRIVALATRAENAFDAANGPLNLGKGHP
jgi:hypothetical protein